MECSDAWRRAQPSILGQNRFFTDCQAGADMLLADREKACSAKTKLARVYALVLNTFDGDATPYLIWMPAHKKDQAAGTLTVGNGEPLTLTPIRRNRAVDAQAKMAVTEHRSDARTVQEWNTTHESSRRRAKWVARATVLATTSMKPPSATPKPPEQLLTE